MIELLAASAAQSLVAGAQSKAQTYLGGLTAGLTGGGSSGASAESLALAGPKASNWLTKSGKVDWMSLLDARVRGVKRKLALALQGQAVKIGGKTVYPGQADASALAKLGAEEAQGGATGGLPSWVVPAGIGVAVLLLVKD